MRANTMEPRGNTLETPSPNIEVPSPKPYALNREDEIGNDGEDERAVVHIDGGRRTTSLFAQT
jgi:hypothetical protein